MIWQTRLGRCIHTSVSGYQVYDNFFYRWLTLGSNPLQTVLNKYHPHKPVLYYIPALTMMARALPDPYCLLGLGGAGVAHLLHATPGIAVEYSEEVIQIARQFFQLDSIHNLSIIHQNASDYVRESPQIFSHILVDLSGPNHFPDECRNESFFAHCKEKLDKNGFIAVNMSNFQEQKVIFDLMKGLFKNTLVMPVNKCANVIVLASAMDDKELFLNLIRSTGEMKQIAWLEYWGYVGYTIN